MTEKKAQIPSKQQSWR